MKITQPYPKEALPLKLDDAVNRVLRHVQAPYPMIVSSAIGAISLACQKGYQIERKPGIIYPIGLSFLTFAVPSERKSTVDRCFLNPIRNFEKTLETEFKAKLQDWKIKDGIHKAKKAGIQRSITKLSSRGEDTSSDEQRLEALEKTACEKPKETKFILNDADKDSILLFLKKYGNSCGVMVDEGGVFFESSAAKHSGMLARLWSGDEIRHDKNNAEGFTLRNPRMSMSIMVQPEIFNEFIKNKGKFWRSSGLLARFLVSYPDSKIGFRPEDVYFPNRIDLSSYDARILKILSSPESSGLIENVTLKFQEEARIALANYANNAESQIAPFGFYSDISDAGSKFAENSARMAALFHVFEGYEGMVSKETLDRAILICNWHIQEFKAMFGSYQPVNSINEDAEEIMRIIKSFQIDNGPTMSCPKVKISQCARGSLRHDAQRREAAFSLLESYRRIQFFYEYNDRTQYVRSLDNINTLQYIPNV